MKTRNFKALGAAAALLFSLGGASTANAFSVTQGLGFPATATDVYQFLCPVGTASARGFVVDAPPVGAPLIRLLLFKGGLLVTAEAPQEGTSPQVTLTGGAGLYEAFITKTAAGSEVYTTRIECISATGAILPAAGPVQTQNQ